MSSLGRALLADLRPDDLDALHPTTLCRLAALVADQITNGTDKAAADDPRPLLSSADAAHRAGVHVETIRRAVRAGALPAGRAGHTIRIAPADLHAWLTGAKPNSSAPPPPRRRGAPRPARRPLTEALASMNKPPRPSAST